MNERRHITTRTKTDECHAVNLGSRNLASLTGLN